MQAGSTALQLALVHLQGDVVDWCVQQGCDRAGLTVAGAAAAGALGTAQVMSSKLGCRPGVWMMQWGSVYGMAQLIHMIRSELAVNRLNSRSMHPQLGCRLFCVKVLTSTT